MFSTASIQELSTSRPDLYAFRVEGRVGKEDMAALAQHMEQAFDAQEVVDLLLYFDEFEGSAPDTGASAETIRSRLRSLTALRRYVVANAPEQADEMIACFDMLLPVRAERFDSMDEALNALGATSMTTA